MVSGAAFEGLADAVRQEEAEAYEPGLAGFGHGLVENVADFYMGKVEENESRGGGMPTRRQHLYAFRKMLGDIPPGEFNANLFIDAVLSSILERLSESPFDDIMANLDYLGEFLDPLVQHLYNQGHNEFSIDLTRMEKYPPSVATEIRGTKKRPLRLTCHGELYFFGSDSRHCVLTNQGNVFYCGDYASSCDIRIFGKAANAALMANGSAFTLADHKVLYNFEGQTLSLPEDCTFYISKELTPYQQKRLRKGGLLGNGNRIFHQGKDSAWEEVLR